MSHFLTDGFQTLIAFAGAPTIKLYEIEVQPPSISIGKPIAQSTMRNTKYNTQASAVLLTVGPSKIKVAYDPTVYTDCIARLGVNDLITTTFPDGSTLAAYGWLDAFTPSTNKEGSRPEADVTIEYSLRNATGVETAPVITAGT